MNHFVPAYDIFYQDEFLKKIENFYNGKAKNLFMHGRNRNDDEMTLDSVMSYFSDLFEGNYNYNIFKKKIREKIRYT